MTRFPRLIWPLLVVLLTVLGGCVYLRLLEVKNQLADFDRNFRVDVADGTFTVHAFNPVLLSEDFLYLTKLRPSRIESLPANGFRWVLDFQGINSGTEGKKAKALTVSWDFNRDQKLTAFGYSRLFLEIAPPAFLEASIRSIGKGRVDEKRQQLKVDPQDLPKVDIHPPTRSRILLALGEPQEKFVKRDDMVFKYRLLADAIPVDADYSDRRIAEVKLSFDQKTDELVKFSGKFAGLKLSIDYRKLTGGAKPEKPADD